MSLRGSKHYDAIMTEGRISDLGDSIRCSLLYRRGWGVRADLRHVLGVCTGRSAVSTSSWSMARTVPTPAAAYELSGSGPMRSMRAREPSSGRGCRSIGVRQDTGAGNHRGSIFRLLVGTALIADRRGYDCPTWGKEVMPGGNSSLPSKVLSAKSAKLFGRCRFFGSQSMMSPAT